MQHLIFGPIISRRFGYSLGVDLSPSTKQCNFDCLYCELKGAKTQDSMREVIPVYEYVDTILRYFRTHPDQKIDVLTFTANGEPTLYPHLLELMRTLKPSLPPHIKTLILSNGSLFWQQPVREALLEFDIIKFSLDSLDERTFERIDRPHKSLSLESIKEGITTFATEFTQKTQGKLIGEILLLKGINDSPAHAKELAQFLSNIPLARLDIGTLDRPPAHRATPLSPEEIESFATHFKGMCVYIPKRTTRDLQAPKRTLTKEELIQALSMRPLTQEDMQALFCESTLALADTLTRSHILQWEQVGNIAFLRPAQN
ncbi:radical SAM protein [uncultured Helicobacter sp.]|uniref:radical SAM protein n=1 Tax=uncultured Helicobacter sp. TaxID=175537 RepID=UPI00374FB354